MSLTNPKNVITEERLSEFYQQILPYLGGMPDILANKFNKSDLYSTDEKIIGQWIDGKPLYQIVLHLTNITINTEYQYNISLLGLNVDVGFGVTPMSYCVTKNKIRQFTFIEYQQPDVLSIHTSVERVISDAYVTFRYTKTTDSPVSIGSDTDYSTTEKIVGTWIDGKPLYQKTINFGTLPDNTSKTVAHNITNFEKAVSISGVMIASNGVCETMPSGENSNFRLQANGTVITVITSTSWASFTESYVTIQYTKTS